ncbi:hypothetical protein SLEP1_g25431 [Rubroshorea leprosula]|uniref:Uncharacterized protein n=2 Tax=Rubroshorea leprosula TaxID=152421 RepID=A0AAV5JLY2_9ROSI|nr:hypothetical protein SLEP1_g25431 [Rubroshorea leprosula]
MAVVLGNLASLPDVASPRIVSTDRKSRPVAVDVGLHLPKRESDGEARAHRLVARGKANSKANAVDFNAENSDDEGNGNGFEEEEARYDWEKEMRKRLKEIEEKEELETKAEELLKKAEAEEGEGDGKELTEEQKMLRVRKELEKAAQEQAERRATAKLMFELGQKAYGKGMYRRSIEFLEGALTIIPRPSLFGGEIQIWLAMAYEANNRHADCIELYLQLEEMHPNVSIRRQAADLRYIYQAPKIKITQEEMVTIPTITSYDSYDGYGTVWIDKDKYKYKNWYKRRNGSTANQPPPSRDFLGELFDFLMWRPPVGLERNRAFWFALTLWFGLVGAALLQQR